MIYRLVNLQRLFLSAAKSTPPSLGALQGNQLQQGMHASYMHTSSCQPQEQVAVTSPSSQRGPPPPKYKPWEFTRHLTRGSAYPRRMRFLIETLEKERAEEIQRARGEAKVDTRSFKSGDVLEVRMAVPEDGGKEKVYRGVCISRHKGHGLRAAFKLYNVYPDGGPVIQHLPLFMPDLKEVKVVGRMNAGSQRKKYHLTQDESISFQKQVGSYRGPSETKEVVSRPGDKGKASSKEKSGKKS